MGELEFIGFVRNQGDPSFVVEESRKLASPAKSFICFTYLIM
jgi:hypothetical protein